MLLKSVQTFSKRSKFCPIVQNLSKLSKLFIVFCDLQWLRMLSFSILLVVGHLLRSSSGFELWLGCLQFYVNFLGSSSFFEVLVTLVHILVWEAYAQSCECWVMIIPVWCYPVSDGARCGIISIQDRIMCVNIYCWVQVLIITYCLCKHRVSNTSRFCQVLSSVMCYVQSSILWRVVAPCCLIVWDCSIVYCRFWEVIFISGLGKV